MYLPCAAGTEPAGDIVFAQYEKKVFENGEIEHKYTGPHPDQRRTKELQAQGMKINLSLSEMSQVSGTADLKRHRGHDPARAVSHS